MKFYIICGWSASCWWRSHTYITLFWAFIAVISMENSLFPFTNSTHRSFIRIMLKIILIAVHIHEANYQTNLRELVFQIVLVHCYIVQNTIPLIYPIKMCKLLTWKYKVYCQRKNHWIAINMNSDQKGYNRICLLFLEIYLKLISNIQRLTLFQIQRKDIAIKHHNTRLFI